MDTPGIVSQKDCKQYHLSSTFTKDPKTCLDKSDIVGIVQDVQNIYTRDKINPNVLELITEDVRSKIPMILILNKIDRVKKKEVLLHLVNVLTGSKNSLDFSDVFMLSALTGDGIDDLRVSQYTLE